MDCMNIKKTKWLPLDHREIYRLRCIRQTSPNDGRVFCEEGVIFIISIFFLQVNTSMKILRSPWSLTNHFFFKSLAENINIIYIIFYCYYKMVVFVIHFIFLNRDSLFWNWDRTKNLFMFQIFNLPIYRYMGDAWVNKVPGYLFSLYILCF